jgi:hypothetical protein
MDRHLSVETMPVRTGREMGSGILHSTLWNHEHGSILPPKTSVIGVHESP